MILVDTGAWYAAIVPTDPNHIRAAAWLAANAAPLLTTDYVVDETLTLLRARGERIRALILGDKFFNSALAQVHHLTDGDIRAAWEVFRKFEDKDWSFTDCASYAVMNRLGIDTAFAFDHHFKQFGGIIVVS